MILLDWGTYRGPFDVLMLIGRDKTGGDRFTATVRALQGGPDSWVCWTDRGTIRMLGWTVHLQLGGVWSWGA